LIDFFLPPRICGPRAQFGRRTPAAFWSGFRAVPERIEFWKQKPFRRHQRILFSRSANSWRRECLYP